jgi:hypothetical protein
LSDTHPRNTEARLVWAITANAVHNWPSENRRDQLYELTNYIDAETGAFYPWARHAEEKSR